MNKVIIIVVVVVVVIIIIIITMSWISVLSLLRSALLCLGGPQAKRRNHLELLSDIDFDIEKGHANIEDNILFLTFYNYS